MKKNNKIWLFIIVCLFVLWCKEVKAEEIPYILSNNQNADGNILGDNPSSNVFPYKNENAVVLCNYLNRQSMNYSGNLNTKYVDMRITIYYIPSENGWLIGYDSLKSGFLNDSYLGRTKGIDGFGNVFDSKKHKDYVYTNINLNEDTFVCPKYGYVDSDKYDSLCFDNDGKYCNSISDALNHSFNTGNQSINEDFIMDFLDSEITINYANQINCDSQTGKISNEDGKTFLYSDVAKVYLKIDDANDMPLFIKNYIDQEALREKDFMKKIVDAKADKCETQLKEKVNSGQASEQTLNEAIKANDSITAEEIYKSIKSNLDTLSNNVQIDTVEPTCNNIFGSTTDSNSLGYWIQKLIDIMRYVAIIILIVMSSIDFVKAITAQDADALKKAGTTFGKRLVFAIIIFFLPSLLNILLKLFGVNGLCGIK